MDDAALSTTTTKRTSAKSRTIIQNGRSATAAKSIQSVIARTPIIDAKPRIPRLIKRPRKRNATGRTTRGRYSNSENDESRGHRGTPRQGPPRNKKPKAWTPAKTREPADRLPRRWTPAASYFGALRRREENKKKKHKTRRRGYNLTYDQTGTPRHYCGPIRVPRHLEEPEQHRRPIRPEDRPLTRAELYQWYKRQGLLRLFFQLYPNR